MADLRELIIRSNHALVPLNSNGKKFAIIDLDEISTANKHNWSISRDVKPSRINRNATPVHTIMLARLINNTPDHLNLRYVDGNTLNLRKSNLVRISQSQSKQDAKGYRVSTSKYKGVSWDKDQNKWLACIQPTGGKTKTLGRYASEIYAAKIYDTAALKYFGKEYTYFNFP